MFPQDNTYEINQHGLLAEIKRLNMVIDTLTTRSGTDLASSKTSIKRVPLTPAQQTFGMKKPALSNKVASIVNRRAILSRLGLETASNSFHLSVSPSSVLAGGIWSVLHGYDL